MPAEQVGEILGMLKRPADEPGVVKTGAAVVIGAAVAVAVGGYCRDIYRDARVHRRPPSAGRDTPTCPMRPGGFPAGPGLPSREKREGGAGPPGPYPFASGEGRPGGPGPRRAARRCPTS